MWRTAIRRQVVEWSQDAMRRVLVTSPLSYAHALCLGPQVALQDAIQAATAPLPERSQTNT